jgi:alkanesulfonate monooxygenase SsuD/methylene tetrahydromethanopterin reductase-like flavin-dependent oxidoreductase (luciferase family)
MSLGIPIANRTDPVRVAEEIAMIDTYSRGRFEMGFVRGAAYEVYPSSGDPVSQTRRFGEAYRLILKALTTHDGPFSWNGEFYKCREVNIWPRCYQDPHPPVWMVAIGAAAGGWIAEQKAKVGTFLNGRASKQLFDTYRRRWLELGLGMPSPNQFGYMAMVAVADTEAEAKRRAYQIAGYVRTQTRLAPQFTNPPGYVPAKFVAKELRLKTDKSYVAEYRTVLRSDGTRVILAEASIDELIDAHVVFAGTPDQVYEQIKAYNSYVGGLGNLLMMGQGGDLSHADTVDSLTLFAREVLPRLKELRVDGYELPAQQRAAA